MPHFDRVFSQNMLYDALHYAGLDHKNSMMWSTSPKALSVVQTALNNEYRNGVESGKIEERQIANKKRLQYREEADKLWRDHKCHTDASPSVVNLMVDAMIHNSRDSDGQVNKISAIKATREKYPQFSLRDAKELVETRMVLLGYPLRSAPPPFASPTQYTRDLWRIVHHNRDADGYVHKANAIEEARNTLHISFAKASDDITDQITYLGVPTK